MGIAALVLGIISIIVSLVPGLGIIVFLPALIGSILGIIDVIIRKKSKLKIGVSLTGFILSFLSIGIMSIWIIVGITMFKNGKLENEFKQIGEKIQVELENENSNSK